MHDYGVKPESFADVCITQRDHAVKNPAAFFYQQPMTLDDYMNAKMIVDPFRLYDCCQETDGGSAVIVTTPERARDLNAGGALIRGVAQGAGSQQEVMTSFYRDDLAEIREMDVVAREVYRISGLGPDDIDAAIVYDAFSSIVLMQLESFGFCKPGEAKDFVKNGNVGLGGRLPINTHGGQLSEAYVHGVNGVIEGVRLIRGDSVNQPPKNDHVLVTAGIGVPTSGMILGKLD
jgi:acetyl-CoA acetyltransferase